MEKYEKYLIHFESKKLILHSPQHRRIQMDEYNFKLDNRDALIKDSIKKAELAAKEHEEKLRAAAESEGSHT